MDFAQIQDWLRETTADNQSVIVAAVISSFIVATTLFVFGWPLAWWSRHKQRASARFYLQEEIQDNLDRLDHLWGELNQRSGRLDIDAPEGIRGAVRLLRRNPPPGWSQAVWTDASVRSAAELNDDERSKVARFYRNLARLEVLRGDMGQPWRTLETGRDPNGAWNLHDHGYRAWRTMQELVPEILEEGNPLPSAGKPGNS